MSHYFLVHVTNCFTVLVSKKAPALNYCQCLLSSPNTWRHWHKMVERLKDIKILKRWMMLKPNFVKLVTLYVRRWLDSNWTRTKSVKWFWQYWLIYEKVKFQRDHYWAKQVKKYCSVGWFSTLQLSFGKNSFF